MGYPALISVSCLIQSEKFKLNPSHISHKNQFHIKVIKSVILRLERVRCLDIRSGIIKGKWKILLLAIKFLYERYCKILSKVKTNNKERIFIICDGGFCFVFMFFVFYKSTFVCFHQFISGGVQPHTDSVPSGLCWNLTRTLPLLPWAQVPQITFPLITLALFGLPPGVTVLFLALYKHISASLVSSRA